MRNKIIMTVVAFGFLAWLWNALFGDPDWAQRRTDAPGAARQSQMFVQAFRSFDIARDGHVHQSQVPYID